jgi:hypothetical protein
VNLLEPVLAYLAEHPYDGPRTEADAIAIERRHGGPPDYADTSVILVGDAPDHLAISRQLLEQFADRIATFQDGTLTFHLDNANLAYQPLYADEQDRAIVFQRCEPAGQANALEEPE